ncbi:MAG: FtsQ-type POTRA domain-containing protein [Clostridia bacterium]|nr:FtsQ-type POTRA domain-containing protein [Clostridia bacterium]
MSRSGTRSGLYRFMVLLLCLTAIVFIGTELFQVEKCTVIGSQTLDNDVIINMSGIYYGDNIFKVDKRLVKNRIEGSAPFPMVHSVSVRLPDEVVISVEERTPVAVIPYLSSCLVIDVNGFILDIVKEDEQSTLPIVEGIHITRLKKGSLLEVSESDNYRYKILTRILESITEWETGGLIRIINLDNPDEITLLTRDVIQVYLGQAVELDRKMGWLHSEAYTQVLQSDQEGKLDISVPGKAVFHPSPAKEEGLDEENFGEEKGASAEEGTEN